MIYAYKMQDIASCKTLVYQEFKHIAEFKNVNYIS